MWSVSRTRPEVLNAIEASTRRSLHAFALTSAPYVPMKPAAIDRLAEVKAPALIVVGDHDMQSIQDAAALTARQIAGATMTVVPGADHGLPIGWARELTAALTAFLQAHN
jgi:pimeloyl-ACP methyl ester carboxylesterase